MTHFSGEFNLLRLLLFKNILVLKWERFWWSMGRDLITLQRALEPMAAELVGLWRHQLWTLCSDSAVGGFLLQQDMLFSPPTQTLEHSLSPTECHEVSVIKLQFWLGSDVRIVSQETFTSSLSEVVLTCSSDMSTSTEQVKMNLKCSNHVIPHCNIQK